MAITKSVTTKVVADKKVPVKRPMEYVEDTIPEVWVDGVNTFLIGSNVSKIVFHTKVANYQNKKNLRLTIPTVELINVCKNILSAAKESEVRMNSTHAKSMTRLTKLLANVPVELEGMEPTGD